MPNFTIGDFWKRRLAVARTQSAGLVPGWGFETTGLASFKEAPLVPSTEFAAESDPESSSILLVSAPGAVGKSTLARQISFATGAVYIDLAKAEPVGGNSLSGGLVKSGLFPDWQAQKAAVLIDGLDEARLRVTQEAFEAFLSDVAGLAKGRHVPTVLFGRTGAVLDAWLVLDDGGIKAPVLEIGYFGPDASVEFAEAQLQAAYSDRSHHTAGRKAIELLLRQLRDQTESDGDRFAGYAPVLQAVVQRVVKEGNPGALVAQIEKGAEPITLQTVVAAILDRERGKLRGLPFEDTKLVDTLYSSEEQLGRLVARLYRLPTPALPSMGPKDAQTYSSALETWVAEHPFLDGHGGTSSAVFDAMITTRALRNPASREAALVRELNRGSAANPFLSEFYMSNGEKTHPVRLPPEHIGVVYSSLRARLSLGDTASLLVDGPEDAPDEAALRAEVEITLSRRDVERPRVLKFETEQIGSVRLGAHIEDVEITVLQTRVEIGPGPEAVLIAPVSIQCKELVVTSSKIVVEGPAHRPDAAVFLEAESYSGDQMVSVPVLRGQVSLAACWPHANAHPWSSFATNPAPLDDPRLDEALRRFRKFVVVREEF